MKFTITIFLAAALSSVAANSSYAETGKKLYQDQCSACHGVTGAGDGPQAGQGGVAAPKPLSQTVTDRMTIEKAMSQGVQDIPGHGTAPLFVGDDLRNLIDYVQKLAHP